MSAGTVALPDARTADHATRFRDDIQGMRGAAVLAVLAFHAGVPFLDGGFVGVDIFFVISGFLITGLIVREIEETGRFRIGAFYARRARRLLPAAGAAILGVACLTIAFLPVTRWADIAGDLLASSLYFVNWRLADRAVDYMHAGGAASPLQHFWSLSVEEQFYIVWPLVVLAGLLLLGALRSSVTPRRLLFALMALIFVGSLAYSVAFTAADPEKAYFVSSTRVWELAAGALLALAARRVAGLPASLRSWAARTGLIMIVASVLLLDSEARFPGWLAVIPVLGAVLLIAGGIGAGGRAPRILRQAWLTRVGNVSYSLYLWHWPFVVVATSLWGSEEGLSPWIGVAATVASAGPALLAYKFVEVPIYRSRALARGWRPSAVVAVIAVSVGVGSAACVVAATPSGGDPAAARGAGALVQVDGAWVDATPNEGASLVPTPAGAFDDFDWTCETTRVPRAEVDECAYNEDGAGGDVVLIGDSHLQHWLPAIRRVADSKDWRLDIYIKQGCSFSTTDFANRGEWYETCSQWNESVRSIVAGKDFDALIVSGIDKLETYSQTEGVITGERAEELIVDGYVDAWSEVAERDLPIVVIRDTPRPGFDVPECLARLEDAPGDCSFRASEGAVDLGRSMEIAADRTDGAVMMDMNDLICLAEVCQPTIGGVIVYRDASHLTMTYAASLSEQFEKRIDDLLDLEARRTTS